jgi:glycosyltransferase involved in cell wall biosynthesis
MSVSVIIPVFNGENYLASAIESVLHQTYSNFEVIIVDDGSADASKEIIRRYKDRDARVKFVEQEHRGAAAAANIGVSCASYGLVARLDADDVMMPDRLERQVRFLEEHPGVSVAGSYMHLIDRWGRTIGKSTPVPGVRHQGLPMEPRQMIDFAHPSVMMRKEALIAVGCYNAEILYGEDQDLWGRFLTCGHMIAIQPEFLVKHRIHNSSMTAKNMLLNHWICQFVYTNLDRRFAGKRELSFDEFQAERHRKPMPERARETLQAFAIVNYKKSSRYYAERQWIRCVLFLFAALALAPGNTFGRISRKISLRRSQGIGPSLPDLSRR